MKSIKKIVLIMGIVCCLQGVGYAMPTKDINEQKMITNDIVNQVNSSNIKSPMLTEAEIFNKLIELKDRYLLNLRNCEPFQISEYIDIFGLKIGFNISIKGWHEDKCVYHMAGKIGGIGKDIREIFGVKILDEDIAKIEPIIDCSFSKELLNMIVDVLVARNQESDALLREMLQSPKKKISAKGDFKLTKEEEVLMVNLLTSKACVITNQEELMQNFSKMMGL